MNRRVFGGFEVAFDLAYLLAALALGGYALADGRGLLAAMALVLAGGDMFHLIPRISVALSGGEKRMAKSLGFGKLVASLSMTAFYVLLWHAGAARYAPLQTFTYMLYALAAVRTVLCLLPQNKWLSEHPPFFWAAMRNIPFVLMGAQVAILFSGRAGLHSMPLAITLSFLFYLPVALWAGKVRALGMLMFPKTLSYLWMLIMLAAAGI